MNVLKSRITLYTITLLLSAVIIIPGFIQKQDPSSIVFDQRFITASLYRGIPVLFILLFISLYGTTDERRRRGWNRPVTGDIPMIILLLALSGILIFIFPAAEKSYTVSLKGGIGYSLIFLLSLTAAFTEELFFRSWLISTLDNLGWPRLIIFLMSVTSFASIHIWQGWNGVFFAGISGAAYTILFMRRPSLFTLITAHAVYNAMAFIIMSVR